jgi:cytochrome P450
MTTSSLYYDHYDVAIYADPYPVYRRLREEAPLYYNDKHGYYALSRFADVERALTDPGTFISGRGAVVELIKARLTIPPGVFIFEDPPVHTMHRRLLAGVFTPRKVASLEPAIREFTARSLDPFAGSSSWASPRRTRR